MAAGSRGTGDLSARMAPALAGVMAPDDNVVASTVAVRAPFFLGYLVIMVALLLGGFATARLSGHLALAVPFLVAGALLNLAWFTGQLSLFLAVTEQQVICWAVPYGAATRAARASRPVLKAPRSAVIATAGRPGPLGQRLRITAPGVSLNLLLTRGGRPRDAAEVITALQAGTAAH